MITRFAYEGILNGVKGVWGDIHPENVVVEKTIMFLTAGDERHVLQNKKTKEKTSTVIIQDESESDNWEEVEREKFPWEKEIDNDND